MPGVLTRRELEVLRLIAEGLSADQIATRLGIGSSTARNHVVRIREKLGAVNRSAALTRFFLGAAEDGRVPARRRRGHRRPGNGTPPFP
jgi:DNA-binding CsgD family transcriptional regulator